MGQLGQSKPDRDLVLDFQSGERGAYEEIYRRYQARVHLTCLRILENPADAAEATQETFLRGFRGLPRFNGRYQLGAWLTRIATNVSLDILRARSRSVPIVASTEEHPLEEDRIKSSDQTVEERVAVSETLTELAPLHGRALVLRAVEGLSHREMAARLQMSTAQVKSLLHRSRNSFKRAWDQASGWFLAPAAWLRPRAKHDVSAASPATGLLAERVATSAVAAAMVMAGFSGSNGLTDSPNPPRDAVPLPVPDDALLSDPEEARAAVAAVREETNEKRAGGSALDPLIELKEELEETIESDLPEEEEENDGDLEVPSSSGKRPVPAPADQVVEEVERILDEQDDKPRDDE